MSAKTSNLCLASIKTCSVGTLLANDMHLFRYRNATKTVVLSTIHLLVALSIIFSISMTTQTSVAATAPYQIACFTADVTIPLNHRCMGVLPTKSRQVVDPLYAHGFVLLGPDLPIVLCAVDWCEIRNGAYDQWRDALAKAAETKRERVLVCSLHQHDAPVTDEVAEKLLSDVGLGGELYDTVFHDQTIDKVVHALRESLKEPQTVSHIGLGQAIVKDIASNRRVIDSAGTVRYNRGSRSASDPFHRQAPEGEIDPYLKTISFWNSDRPVLAIHCYATHPMSSYGRGLVSSDFVGLARARRQRDDPHVRQIYLSGCSGDVTAGKYNDGSVKHREQLIDRLYSAMVEAWDSTDRLPITTVSFRNAKLELPFHPGNHLTEAALRTSLNDNGKSNEERILAAMGLASRLRSAHDQPIDFPCIDFGKAQMVLFPGETFVAYQLLAQKMRPDSFVMSIGYGECWPGYIPSDSNFDEHFEDKWLWVGPGSEQRIRRALETALSPP